MVEGSQDIWRYRQWMEEIDAADAGLFNNEETRFLESMRSQLEEFATLTERQIEWLQALYVKIALELHMSDHEKKIDECCEVMERFCSPWEIGFLDSLHEQLVERRRPLSAKQADKLDSIHRHVCEAEEREMRGR